AVLQAEEKGEISARPPGAPRYASSEALAEHAASSRSGIEERLLALGREQWLHPGHVVSVLASAGALDDAEFERRGPLLLARLLARDEIRAGFVTGGRFTPWELPLAELVEHIGTTWTAIGGRTPGPDMIAWFELTAQGRAAVGTRGVRAMAPGMSGYDSPGVVGGSRGRPVPAVGPTGPSGGPVTVRCPSEREHRYPEGVHVEKGAPDASTNREGRQLQRPPCPPCRDLLPGGERAARPRHDRDVGCGAGEGLQHPDAADLGRRSRRRGHVARRGRGRGGVPRPALRAAGAQPRRGVPGQLTGARPRPGGSAPHARRPPPDPAGAFVDPVSLQVRSGSGGI